MTYDVQLGNEIRRGLTYAALVVLPIEPTTFVRRNNSDWILAKDCVELTHLLANIQVQHINNSQSLISDQYLENSSYQNNDGEENYEEDCEGKIDNDENVHYYEGNIEDNEYYEDDLDENNFEDFQPRQSNTPDNFGNRASYRENVEDRIFIPSAEYFKSKQKRKAAIIGVCTLGLAGLALIGVGNTWRSNIFQGTSFMSNAGIGFVLKCLSFCLLTALIAIPYFIYSVFALIYYSIRLNKLKR